MCKTERTSNIVAKTSTMLKLLCSTQNFCFTYGDQSGNFHLSNNKLNFKFLWIEVNTKKLIHCSYVFFKPAQLVVSALAIHLDALFHHSFVVTFCYILSSFVATTLLDWYEQFHLGLIWTITSRKPEKNYCSYIVVQELIGNSFLFAYSCMMFICVLFQLVDYNQCFDIHKS